MSTKNVELVDWPQAGWHTDEWYAAALGIQADTLRKSIRHLPVQRKVIGRRTLIEAVSLIAALPEDFGESHEEEPEKG